MSRAGELLEKSKPKFMKDILGKERREAEKILRDKYGQSEAEAAENVALYLGAKSGKVI